MNLKNKIKNSAILGVSALMMTGCASDYLDTPYHGVTTSSDIAKTTENARATMLTLAAGMGRYWAIDQEPQLGPAQALNQGEVGMGYYFGEVPGQDCYVNFIYDVAPSWTIFYNQDPGMINSGGYVWQTPMWMYCYANIAQANELLYYIDGAEGSEEMREYTKAQTYTLRAHFYYRLLQMYGPRWEDSNNGEKLCSVVMRTTIDEPQDKAVSPMNEILDLIYSDLDNAIDCFSRGGTYDRTQTYEPDLNIAYGVYARVAALKHDWEKCREMANKARQGYRPATTAEAMSGYSSFNQHEWMWSPSFNDVDNAIYGNWSTFMCCNTYAAINDRYTNSINITLYRQIPETDARREWWLTVDKLSGVNMNMAYSSRGVNSVNQQFTAAALVRAARTWLDDHQTKYGIPGEKAYSGTGSGVDCTSVIRDGAQVKFWANGLIGSPTRANVPYMRATEMYLLEAEACAELGLTSEAQALLQEVNRPHNPEYTCTASGQALIDEVRLYRRVELWGEGFNWYDLKRWNLPLKREAWVEGDTKSGNIPEALGVEVPATRNNGWRYGIPNGERSYNMLITSSIPGEVVDGKN